MNLEREDTNERMKVSRARCQVSGSLEKRCQRSRSNQIKPDQTNQIALDQTGTGAWVVSK